MNRSFIIIFMLALQLAAQAMESLPDKQSIHPLSILSAQLVHFLAQQDMVNVVSDISKVFAQVGCDSDDGHIVEILTEQAYPGNANLWSIQYAQKDKKHFLQLYKQSNEIKLPSLDNLTNAYNKIFESVQLGWLQVKNPGRRKDIRLPSKPNEYKLFIKETALPAEEWLLSYMGYKYEIFLTVSNMFMDSREVYGFMVPKPGPTNRIYWAIKKKEFQDVQTKLGLKLIIQQEK